MTGLYTGSWDNPELEAMGSALVPSTTSDVLGATAGAALSSNPTPRLLAASGDQINQGVAVDDYGRTMDIGAPAPMLDPDAANSQYGIKGALSFDRPVTAQTAQELHDAKHNAILRADVVARGQGGLVQGGLKAGTGFVAGLLDPLNLAAGLVPGVGEARFGALLGDSALGQIGARAASGFTAGAAGMAALEPLNALLDSREGNDWTMSQALRDIAFGGVLGGGLHVLGGAIGDRLGQPSRPVPNPITDRMEAAGYDARDMALRGAVGQAAEGRAVDIAPALDLSDARAAEGELQQWAQQQQRLTAEAEQLHDAAQVPGAPDRSAEIEAAGAQLEQLKSQASQYRSEIEAATADARRSAMDPETSERMAQIQAELNGVIPRARRADLVQEQAMLAEGRGGLDVAGSSDLDVARSQAQARGLSVALDRVQQRADATAARLSDVQAADAADQAEASDAQAAAAASTSLPLARVRSRQAVTTAMAERSVRRFAGRMEVALEPGEAASFARDLMAAGPAEVSDTINHMLGSIADRSSRPDVAAALRQSRDATPDIGDAVATGVQQFRDIGDNAAINLADSAAKPVEHPEDAPAAAANADAVQRAPAVPPEIAAALADAEKGAQDMRARVDGEVQAGRLTEADTAELRAADTAAELAEGDAKALEAAATCLAGAA